MALYGIVTEIPIDNEGNINGYTEYKFMENVEMSNVTNPTASLGLVSDNSIAYYDDTTEFRPQDQVENKVKVKSMYDKNGVLLNRQKFEYSNFQYETFHEAVYNPSPYNNDDYDNVTQIVRYPYLLKEESIDYFKNDRSITKTTDYVYQYEDWTFLPNSKTMSSSDGYSKTVNYNYQTNNFNGTISMYLSDINSSTENQANIYSVLNNRNVLTEIKTGKTPSTLETKTKYEYDADGNMVTKIQFTPGLVSNASYESYVYGYSNRFPVAVISGLKYTDIPINYITGIKNASNQAVTPANTNTLRNAQAALRTWVATNTVNPMAQIATSTYNPVYGVTSTTSPNGQMTVYDYDIFGRLTFTRIFDPIDNDYKIISENTYNTRAN